MSRQTPVSFAMSCPVPRDDGETVQLAHGGGGRLMHRLLESVFLPALGEPGEGPRHDGATFAVPGGRVAFTTDSYVVSPLEFPGGDIGTLAVCGTVNDLAMCGAAPAWLSTAFVLEEGLSIDVLRRIVASMARAARAAGVRLVTGDTKVVDRGRGDGLFINTSGIGVVGHGLDIHPRSIRDGDAVIVSGDLGRHGVAIMAVREGLAFESAIESDVAPLSEPVEALLAAGVPVRCLRDLTRGGLATALVEIAHGGAASIDIDETRIPVGDDVRGACELLGLDPLYVANEGRFVAVVPEAQADAALAALAGCRVSAGAVRVGRVGAGPAPLVTARTAIGTRRVLDMLSGDQLPRIC